MSERGLKRLVRALESKVNSRRLPNNIRDALTEVLKYIQQGKVIVETPRSINAHFRYYPVVSLEYFLCPECRRVYNKREAAAELKCRSCDSSLIQAYVGAPTDPGAMTVFRVSVVPSPPGGAYDYFILPTGVFRLQCPRHKGLKGLKAENPQRPFYTLRYTCPFSDSSCDSYDRGFCKDGGSALFFPRGKIRRAIARPSEGLTRPYVEVVFQEMERMEDLTERINRGLGARAFSGAFLGRFKVHVLSLFYLIGHSYAPRRNRIPALAFDDRSSTLRVAGRSMTTTGLLLRLDPERVSHVIEILKGFVPIDEIAAAHSVAHAAMKAIVMLSGLSYGEFGEAVYADGEQLEVLIYDDSPGGVGGVDAIRECLPDFLNRLMQSAAPCPRACRTACRACLYVENCGSLNFMLSWMAANMYLRGGEL